MARIPFPSNDRTNSVKSISQQNQSQQDSPWLGTKHGEPQPMMLQVQFHDGSILSYAYSDLRETRLRDAGHLVLCIFGMEKYHVTIEGRHLNEVAKLIGMGKIKKLIELGPRTFDRPEESTSIDKITVDTLTGPAF